MRCQAKIFSYRKLINDRQCLRETKIGIFCVFHTDYIQKIENDIDELKQELMRIKSLGG